MLKLLRPISLIHREADRFDPRAQLDKYHSRMHHGSEHIPFLWKFTSALFKERFVHIVLPSAMSGIRMPHEQLERVQRYMMTRLSETDSDIFMAEIDEHALKYEVKRSDFAAFLEARIHLQPLTRNYAHAAMLPEACCEVKDSPVHGMGVFALRNIRIGEYITLYPADGIGFQPKAWRRNPHLAHAQVLVGDMDHATAARHTLGIHTEDAGLVTAIGDPSKYDNPHYLGHMINDAVKLSSPDSVHVYLRVSRLRENCIDAQNLNVMVASRDIQAGEEIFYSYGVKYWLHNA